MKIRHFGENAVALKKDRAGSAQVTVSRCARLRTARLPLFIRRSAKTTQKAKTIPRVQRVEIFTAAPAGKRGAREESGCTAVGGKLWLISALAAADPLRRAPLASARSVSSADSI